MIYKFCTLLKGTPWGGHRLRRLKGLEPTEEPIGESWEVSAVPGMESTVDGGPESGKSLTQLIAEHGEGLLGRRVTERYGHTFPILIKFIDSSQWLSVQVHPDDALAREIESPQAMGKSEMWHIIDSTPGAELIAGFKPGVTREDYVRVEGTEELLELTCRHAATPGRDFYIPAGTIHAIGPGCLLAEVQQSSDLTYRVYDYGRPREIHLDKARRALSFASPSPIDTPLTELFTVESREATEPTVLPAADGSFSIVMILGGDCSVDGIAAPAGTTLLISADHGPATLTPSVKTTYLSVTL